MSDLITCAPPIEDIELRLLYDAFSPSTVEIHELVYQEGKSLAHYLDGLPAESEWMVFHNGLEIALPLAHTIVPARGDKVGLIQVPLGGDGFKSVLRLALQAAAIAVAIAFPHLGWLAIMAINIGVGLVNMFLLTPRAPKTDSHDQSASYGIDGPKNSATENIPYPVIYGEYRFGGNLADTYTENVGDEQYLYMRSVFNDGEIEGIYDIELNEQPIANFTAVESRIKKGTLTEIVNTWFGRSLRQVNTALKLDTAWTSHQTATMVDHVRFDVAFAQGLVSIDSKKGTYRSKRVNFEMEYRLLDPTTKLPVAGPNGEWTGTTANPSNYLPTDDLTTVTGIAPAQKIQVFASGTYQESNLVNLTGVNVGAQYRVAGGAWTPMSPSLSGSSINGYALDPSGALEGYGDLRPVFNQFYEIEPGNGIVDIEIPGGTINQVIAYTPFQKGTAAVSDNRTRSIRRSFESGQLTYGFYELRIRRTTPTSTSQYEIDECYLTDIAEIQSEQVALRGTANLSLRVKLNEQLNGIPTITGRCKGSLLQEYDIEGNPTIKRWSANAAWVGLDILCGVERGCGYPKERIDWAGWFAFAEHCRINNIGFNGVFEEGSNVGDALVQVLRIAHAAPVPQGNKISVAIDRPRNPVCAFGAGNIIKGTMSVTYMSMAERANEFEVSYFDKTDRNKQKTLRYVDPKAVTFNESKRASAVTLLGVDNFAQAQSELWRNIYSNRLLVRALDFETGLESINLVQGENALISHPMMEWGESGRTKAGSTTTRIQLDQDVTLTPGKTYTLIIVYDALQQATATVSSVVGNRILVPTNAALSATNPPMRVTAGTVDAEVVSVVKGGIYDTILLDTAAGFAGGTNVAFWTTDVLVERNVVVPGVETTQSFVDLDAAMPVAPDALKNFIFGEVSIVQKPYTLVGISGNGIEKRRLMFAEYHEGVYGPPEVEILTPVKALSDRDVGHVQTLLFDYERVAAADRKVINGRVHWSAGGIRNYQGADVYMALNGGAMRPINTVLNVTELNVSLNLGDEVEFMVVAYNKRGDRAPTVTAPGIRAKIEVTFADLDAPEDVNVVVTNFEVEGTAQVTITPPSDMTGVKAYEGRYRKSISSTWISLGTHDGLVFPISGLETATYIVSARAVSNETSVSEWVDKEFVVAVAPGSIMADFLSQNNRNAAAIAAPTTAVATDVEHSVNTDGSVDLSFEWGWAGDEGSIDGFEVIWGSAAT